MTISERPTLQHRGYDGASSFPEAAEPAPAGSAQVALTGATVVLPFIALAVAIFLAWGQGITTDPLLAGAFYTATGLGVTVGFHRLLTHGSFTALIRLFERLGWATDVHWPDPARLQRRRARAPAGD